MPDPIIVTAQERDFLTKQLLKYTSAKLGNNGLRCAKLLVLWLGGLHDVSRDALREADWSGEHLTLDISNERFATYDFNYLTKLVVLAHDLCIRCELVPTSDGGMLLSMSPRDRDGEQWDRHPTMEQHLAAIRSKYWPETTPAAAACDSAA